MLVEAWLWLSVVMVGVSVAEVHTLYKGEPPTHLHTRRSLAKNYVPYTNDATDNDIDRDPMLDRCGCCAGAAGTPGIPGVPGTHGLRGQDGAKGEPGTPGKPGVQGPPGSRGKKGHAGPAGPKGDRGDQGDRGFPGLPGRPARGGDGGTAGSGGVSTRHRVAFSTVRTMKLGPVLQDTPIIFDRIVSNVGNAFNEVTSHFIAPYNGTYVFMTHILGQNHKNGEAWIMHNSKHTVPLHGDGRAGHGTGSQTIILGLVVSDHVWLQLTKDTGLFNDYSTFSGYLLFTDAE